MVSDLRPAFRQRLWRLVNTYRLHFPNILLVSLAGILITAYVLRDSNRVASALLCGLLLFFFMVYYSVYLLKFKKLTDVYSPREYYYDVYDLWGVSFLNVIFFLVYPLILYQANSIFPIFTTLGPEQRVDYISMLRLSSKNVIDALTLGTFSALGLSFLDVGLRIEHWGGRIVFHIYNLVVELTIVAVVYQEITFKMKLKRAFEKIRLGKEAPDVLLHLDSHGVSRLVRYMNEHENDPYLQKQVVAILSSRSSLEVRDMLLKIMMITRDIDNVFIPCLDYFAQNRDRRFRRVIKRIKDKTKRQILKERGILK